jgi:hypothetical protein
MFEVSVEIILYGVVQWRKDGSNIALNGTVALSYDLPKPRIVVIAYTGQTSFLKTILSFLR